MTKYVVAKFTSTFCKISKPVGSVIVIEFGPQDTTDVTVDDVRVFPPLVVISKSNVIVRFREVSTTTFLQFTLFVSHPSVTDAASLTAPTGNTVPRVTDVTSQYNKFVVNASN